MFLIHVLGGSFDVNNYYINMLFVAALALPGGSFAASKLFVNQTSATASGLKSCGSVVVDPPTYVILGKSSVIRLSTPAIRLVVGGQASSRAGKPTAAAEGKNTSLAPSSAPPALPATASDSVADVEITLLSPTELFFLGRKAGSMNVIVQSANGRCSIKDIIVTIDPDTLQAKLAELMPEESGIKVKSAENALVLTGKISDAAKLDEAVSLAAIYGDGKKVVNLLRVMQPQQVMLEVKIAEVSKTLLDQLGASFNLTRSSTGGRNNYSLLSSFLSGDGLLAALKIGRSSLNLDGENDNGLVRVLAEPNIMAISGQQASFLSGGKIFIPVSQTSSIGSPTITLEEQEFGIGVKFTPTVLDGTRINLKMVSEVSDLSQLGSPFSTVNGVTSILPSMTVRRADTTVQLNDGQSFAIAGLIKNNATATMKRFPGLGEVPILGALFRSSQFQTDQTELLFVVTPHLVKPLAEAPRLPTDNHVVPSRAEVYFNGSLESATPAPAAAGALPQSKKGAAHE